MRMSEPAGVLRAARRAADDAALRDALLSGGDSRLAIDPATQRNKYFCPPSPAPELAGLASCTASPVRQSGWNRAATEFDRVRSAPSPAARAGRLDALRAGIEQALLAWFGAAATADAILTPSGTDAVLLAASLLALEQGGGRLTAILPSASETGTGVPSAAACRGFDPGPFFGRALAGADLDALHVALRGPDGAPREDGALCEAFAAAAGTAQGLPVVYLTHGSKTGLVAPLRVPAGVEVVVDACQMRLSPETARSYLARGWPVVVTGSKFLGGPAFSGAVLIPRGRFAAVRGRARDACLRTAPPGAAAEIGPLLRWTAALDALPAMADAGERIPSVIASLSREIDAAVGRLDGAEPIQGPSPDMIAAGGWPGSITTFAVRDPADLGRRLTVDELKPLHRALALAGVLVGQPVSLGAFGGLRVAAGACDVAAGTMRAPLDRLIRVWGGAAGARSSRRSAAAPV